MKSVAAHRPDTVAAHQAAVERVVRHMKANLIEWDADLSLKTLAKQACYSVPHLIEIFEDLTGITPHHFLASLRIQKAKDILLNTDTSVTETALEVGYQSLGTFCRTFAAQVGVTPSEFRLLPRRLSAEELIRRAELFAKKRREPHVDIRGNLLIPSGCNGIVFVGAFSKALPQGTPIDGTLMFKSGNFALQLCDEEKFFVLAANLPLPSVRDSPLELITTHIGRSHRALCNSLEHTIRLRPRSIFDPPILLALPALLPAV